MKKLLAVLFLLFACGSAWADTYYCLIFAYDSKPVPIPCKSHIFGTFARLDDDGKLVEHFTISWGPDKVTFFRSRPGSNTSLKDELDDSVRLKRSVRMWGPFETDKDFYLKAKQQHQADGRYRFIDGFTRKRTQNCIHRLSDVAGHHKTGIYWGWWAGNSVYKHYRRCGVIRDAKDDSVVRLLGVNNYPVRRMR